MFGVDLSSPGFGDGGGVGGGLNSSFEPEPSASSEVFRNICRPFRFGTKKLYAM